MAAEAWAQRLLGVGSHGLGRCSQMDPTISQSQIVIPSSHSLCSSLLTGNMFWNPSISSGRQRNITRRMSWAKQGQGTVNFGSLQQSRCRSTSLAFKRHLENRDQEPSSKHFLSEDKMAARFNNLSLDNDHIYSSNGFPIHNKDPKWQEAYTRLKELQQRLSQDGTCEETRSTEETELENVIVDGEFIMADSPVRTNLALLPQPFDNQVSLVPEEVFLTLNPCTEVVLWSPPGNSGLQSIRTLMSMPSSLSSSAQDQRDVASIQEEMEV